ncbi:MAG: hypothetical protein IJ127_03945 [Afipia sp.]|jgi:sarcosine oxidase|nr:hypothetical protein [Afipia sp.]
MDRYAVDALHRPAAQNPCILPPITYPDGHTWPKLGGDPLDITLKGDADIKRWFQSGGSMDVADQLQETILDVIRDLKFEERRVVPCMTTFGETGLPSIGSLLSVLWSQQAATARVRNVRTNWDG